MDAIADDIRSTLGPLAQEESRNLTVELDGTPRRGRPIEYDRIGRQGSEVEMDGYTYSV